ncbi:hypothetical protein SAMN05444266_10412 [Chitinophaga jiangningensis]|uniref:Uncharacterized protein n=1 Tax=Chitinophaga jiangningensis TaxID=1419482 RepID=A0A1M7BQ65_9BACT|nr:hypothetical protein SAMN05444266_10412 [Chitinophaga jiangningensis]
MILTSNIIERSKYFYLLTEKLKTSYHSIYTKMTGVPVQNFSDDNFGAI